MKRISHDGSNLTLIIGIVIGLVVFIIDLYLPFGKAATLLFIVPIIIISWKYGTTRTVISLAVFYSILALLKIFISKDEVPEYVLFNRIMFAVVLGVITFVQLQRRKSDSALKKANAALLESEERFHQLADSQPQIVWTADINGNIEYYNRQWYEYTGLSVEESFSRARRKVFLPEELQKILDLWGKSLEAGQLYENTVRIRRKDGEYCWHLTRVTPVKDNRGRIQKWIGTATNIQEQKLMQDKLEQLIIEQKRSNKELEQFAYIASHDLQEPLRMVTNYIQLLDKKYKEELDERAGEYIKFAVEGSKRMVSLINDLLAYSRVTTKAKGFESVNLNEIFENVKTDMQISIEETGAKVNAGSFPSLEVDATQFRQLLQNLVGNAIKFRSDIPPVVEIHCEKRKKDWVFSVKDNGIGIEAKFHERIFMIFQRLHEREKYPGTGIGLALCKKIVERHGGQIWVESEPGNGTTFYFTIPENP